MVDSYGGRGGCPGKRDGSRREMVRNSTKLGAERPRREEANHNRIILRSEGHPKHAKVPGKRKRKNFVKN